MKLQERYQAGVRVYGRHSSSEPLQTPLNEPWLDQQRWWAAVHVAPYLVKSSSRDDGEKSPKWKMRSNCWKMIECGLFQKTYNNNNNKDANDIQTLSNQRKHSKEKEKWEKMCQWSGSLFKLRTLGTKTNSSDFDILISTICVLFSKINK